MENRTIRDDEQLIDLFPWRLGSKQKNELRLIESMPPRMKFKTFLRNSKSCLILMILKLFLTRGSYEIDLLPEEYT